MGCAQLLVVPYAENAALQKMVLLALPEAFSLSCSVTNGEVVCAYCLMLVLLRSHATVASENFLLSLSPNE